MRSRSCAQRLWFGWLAILLVGACRGTAGTNAPDTDLFTNGPVLQISIEIAPTNVASLRKEPRKAVPVTIKEGGKNFTQVALHLKGALGSFRDIDDKPGMVLNFGKLNSDQRFHGLRKIMLNNSVQDPSYFNECLAGELFRAADVPCPRTTHAMVELNGRKLGLYVLKEAFDKNLLRLHFHNTDGNFYDINQGFYDLGNESDLKTRFRLDSGKGPENASDLAALIRACQEQEPSQCWTKLNTILDTDRFISFMAMEVITCHIDGYSVYGHNFRIYDNPQNNKLVFIPNDMDRMFGNPNMPVMRANFSAQASSAVMRTPEGRRKYRERATYLCTNVFNLTKLTNQVNSLQARLVPVVAAWNPDEAAAIKTQARVVCDRLTRRAAFFRQEVEQIKPVGLPKKTQ